MEEGGGDRHLKRIRTIKKKEKKNDETKKQKKTKEQEEEEEEKNPTQEMMNATCVAITGDDKEREA